MEGQDRVSWQPQMDMEELVRQFLDLKRNCEDLTRRVEWLENEVLILSDRR